MRFQRFLEKAAKGLEISEKYRNNKKYRAEIDKNPDWLLEEMGIEKMGHDVMIHTNSPETRYMIIPEDPNLQLREEEAAFISAGQSTRDYYASRGNQKNAADIAEDAIADIFPP